MPHERGRRAFLTGGVYGRFADVDLNRNNVTGYSIPEEWIEKHLGGRGIGARILVEELPKGAEPLAPENILIVATGPFQGTGIPGGSRNAILSVSPVTGCVSDSYVGGYFPHELGQSGFDGLIIRGRSDEPVYLLVQSGKVQILDASALWGKDVLETVRLLQERHKGVRVACIGVAGEREIQFACILNDVNRAAGRPGFGCVMGSKKLKAIAVAGHKKKDIFDQDQFAELRHEYRNWLMQDPATQKRQKYGTAKCIMEQNELGILPTKNFQSGVFDAAIRISGETIAESILTRRETCTGCPVACKRVVETEFQGERVVGAYGGMEYETVAAFGSLCLVDDLAAIALASQKCNLYGLDTIATGVAIATAMEATARGRLKEEGIAWGDAASLLDLIDQIANREGLGGLLAEGMQALEKEWGSDFILHVKGQAVPMHDVRAKKGMGISYATSPRGATHMEGLDDEMFIGAEDPNPLLGIYGKIDWLSWYRKPELCVVYENLMSFTNSLIMCAFVSLSKCIGRYYPYGRILRLLRALTGMDLDEHGMLEIGERNYRLLRRLNEANHLDAGSRKLPKRFEIPLPSGPCKGERILKESLEDAVSAYEELRSDSDGVSGDAVDTQ